MSVMLPYDQSSLSNATELPKGVWSASATGNWFDQGPFTILLFLSEISQSVDIIAQNHWRSTDWYGSDIHE